MKRTGRFFVIMLVLLMLATCAAAEDSLLSLEGYTIVYGEGCGPMVLESAKALAKRLGLPAATDAAEAAPLEILVGPTNRAEASVAGENLGQFDYRSSIVNGKLVLIGGSDVATLNAVAALLYDDAALTVTDHPSLAAGYAAAFDGADSREDYINDPSLFLCNWALEFKTPEWMLDFNEKMASFADPAGRVMSVHHRGSWTEYPENSIEGIISSILMGADCVEVDLRLTKDRVLVLMHDDTLNRTTDWSSKAGKNGLPESSYLSDWTYDELRQLQLLDYNGKETGYQVPSFREVLQVCNGRTTLYLDKGEAWSWDNDVYPLVQELGAWQTCVVGSYSGAGKGRERSDDIYARSGLRPVLLFGGFTTNNAAEWQQRLDDYCASGHEPVLLWTDMKGNSLSRMMDKVGDAVTQITGKTRFWAFVQFMGGGKDNQKSWQALYENGVSILVTDRCLHMQQYIAETFGPDER